MPRDLKATGPLPEEDTSIKRQVNRLHKSRPSDLSYMKGRHHLEWHWFRNYGVPDWRRRRERLGAVGIRITRAIGPTSATLVDLFDGCLMGNPPVVELANRGRT